MWYNQFDPNIIKLVRGNSLDLAIGLVDSSTGEAYILQPNDTVLFSVKRDGKTVIQKRLTSADVEDTVVLCSIAPEETVDLITGDYIYDCLLVTASGEANTFVQSVLIVKDAVGTYRDLEGDQNA